MRHARGARRRHSILEHASPVLGSDLGKKVDPGEARPARARPGTPGGAGRGALLKSPSAPANPVTLARGPHKYTDLFKSVLHCSVALVPP